MPIDRNAATGRPRLATATKPARKMQANTARPASCVAVSTRELALQHAGRRPRHRRERDEQLSPAPVAPVLARHLGSQSRRPGTLAAHGRARLGRAPARDQRRRAEQGSDGGAAPAVRAARLRLGPQLHPERQRPLHERGDRSRRARPAARAGGARRPSASPHPVVLRTFAELGRVAHSHPFGADTSKTNVAFLGKEPRAGGRAQARVARRRPGPVRGRGQRRLPPLPERRARRAPERRPARAPSRRPGRRSATGGPSLDWPSSRIHPPEGSPGPGLRTKHRR